jgi:ComF family protein
LDVGIIFGEELAKVVNDNRWPVDVIVPIPLGKLHKQERGYNQAGVLARSTALQLNLPMDDKSIRRKRETFTQVKLSNEERRKNLVDAFEVTGHRLDGKRVLIVDDVITTGTTINSCAGAVISSGAKEVYALSLGRSIITNVSA